MRNVNLPMPVAVVAGVLCLLGGYLIGVVVGPDTPARTTAQVDSYNSQTNELCLAGSAVREQGATVTDGRLCGTWRRVPGSLTPRPGDTFRFVAVVNTSGGQQSVTFYGDVVSP